jgi:hypothetical protein
MDDTVYSIVGATQREMGKQLVDTKTERLQATRVIPTERRVIQEVSMSAVDMGMGHQRTIRATNISQGVTIKIRIPRAPRRVMQNIRNSAGVSDR